MGESLPPGKYVVLGASGLAGSHLLEKLANQKGVEVLAVSGKRVIRSHAKNIQPLHGDLTDKAFADKVIKAADYVFAFAGVVASSPVLAKDPIGAIQINLDITKTCLEAAWTQQVRHCVWLSSTTGYPDFEGEITEEAFFEGDPPGNWFGLGWMTRYLERFAFHLSENVPNPIAITALRPSLIYGENDHFSDEQAHFLPALIRRVVMRETPLEVWGTGEQARDVVHGQDVAEAAFLSIKRPAGFRSYNIASGKSYSVNHILKQICEIDGFEDADIRYRLDKPQTLQKRSFAIEKAKAELEFEAKISLDEGLKRTISWYREYHTKAEA